MSTGLVSIPNGRPEVDIVGGLVAWFEACPKGWFETRSEIGFEAGFEAGLEPCKEPSTKADDRVEGEVGMA